jgi:hypothetical protein
MDIEQFYAADERRRESAEFEFGSEWTDANGYLYELSWVEATGELYLMAGPEAQMIEEPIFGDALSYPQPLGALFVRVIGTYRTVDEVEAALTGWESAMVEANSVAWIESHAANDSAI